MSPFQTCLECSEQFNGLRCSCGWQPKGSNPGVIFRNTEHPIAMGVTKEEFGIQLFNTVQSIGELMQIRILLGRVAMGELPANDYKQREGKVIDQVRTGLLALKADEVTQVVRRYPWVAAL